MSQKVCYRCGKPSFDLPRGYVGNDYCTCAMAIPSHNYHPESIQKPVPYADILAMEEQEKDA